MRRLAVLLLFASALPTVAQETIRFGVFSLFNPNRLTVRPAQNQVLLLTIASSSSAVEDDLSISASGDSLLVTASGRTIRADSVLVSSRNGDAVDFTMSVPGKIVRDFRGRLAVFAANNRLVPVVEVERELAVAIAVKAEAPPGAPLEALKAQAVIARSFYTGSKDRHPDFDFCDTTHCQLFKGLPKRDDPAWRAAQGTRGVVLRYQGKVIPAMFSASCGGRTRTLHELSVNANGYPYYSIEDAYCERDSRRWQARLSSREATTLSESRSEHDRLALGRKVGWNVVPSNNYDVKHESGTLIFEGKGLGHGLGLCQHGASQMAREGAGFREILARYFPNTTVGE